jgi:hypothetical protein
VEKKKLAANSAAVILAPAAGGGIVTKAERATMFGRQRKSERRLIPDTIRFLRAAHGLAGKEKSWVASA